MSIRWAVVLLGTLVAGCSTTRVVRLETGRESRVVSPREEPGTGLGYVELDEEEFHDAVMSLARDVRPFANPLREARNLFGVPERSGVYLYQGGVPRLVPLEQERDLEGLHLLESYADDSLTRAYGQWCQRKGRPGDCLRLLTEGPLLASDGKYALAMATVTASLTMYLMLWSLPEPVSKGAATLMTAVAIAYLGVDTVWRLLDGWISLVRQVERATTFEQISAAGEAHGAVLGENAARVFVMLATAAIGSTVGLAAKASHLPGSAQAALVVESQAGFRYAALTEVQAVAVATEGFTITLAPNALAMATDSMKSGGSQSHHLATDKNDISRARGGPWTPEFRRIFKRAGMELKDPENIVDVPGHRGPHPRRYHELVFRRLNEAVEGCRSVESCRKALTAELQKLAREAVKKGTEIHRLLTEGR
ncbi:AHH domain-containing protein [Myxococcus stipitatus]|uniref:AHH domain-containing protein n=1 Tax=Myxococcus stipitatus TaxID=83455 RepID=UPI001F435F2D|nr:AHH domain-containing protein [Myxococcus stipitatus]MCE9668487.1 AHH domain-containing protein [Myxococcus stipitatus]